MADDDVNAFGRELACAVDNMAKHRVTGYRMQHLGQSGTHASALTRGENDDIERHEGIPDEQPH